ncbi:hypothetical protein L5515_014149 [Caenorhabditis briggsae]|uniref:C-type lectin domain-containing protein n=1 Tax=Caenorhabditis briggsae TaxID=6238 RepID=A0AAE9ECE1_CAEBR|nr:hypothetical protein L5515_014149 [Caenorhabditis briggsae]
MTSKKFLLSFLIGFILCLGIPVIQASNCKDSYVDRVCGEDQTNLWLDIVCVVDNSVGMTNAGLASVAASISSLFVDGQQLRNHWNKAHLVNEYTQTKHDYVLQVVRNNTAFKQPYTYFIGLSYVNGNWQWEQPDGMDPIVVQNWSDWNPGFPTASSTATVGVNVQTSPSSMSTGWQNTRKDLASMYVCEVASCDSTNYCTAEDI